MLSPAASSAVRVTEKVAKRPSPWRHVPHHRLCAVKLRNSGIDSVGVLPSTGARVNSYIGNGPPGTSTGWRGGVLVLPT